MSVIKLNLNNVEELLFSSESLCHKLSRHKQTFVQWKFAYMNSSLRSLRKKIVIDFLKSLDDNDVETISLYFGTTVTIDTKVDYRIVTSMQFPIEEAADVLNATGPAGNMTSYRDKDTIYLSFWR